MNFHKVLALEAFVVVLALNEPRSVLELWTWLHMPWRLGYWFSILLVVGQYVAFGTKRFCGVGMSMVALLIWLVIDGLLLHHSYDFGAVIYNPLACMTLILMAATFAEKGFRSLTLGAFAAYAILVIANLFSMIAAPEGLYEATASTGEAISCWVLGFKNSLHEYCIVFTCLSLLVVELFKADKMLPLISILIMMATVAIAGSGTGIVVGALLTAMYLTGCYSWKWVSVFNIGIGYLLVLLFLMNQYEFDFIYHLTDMLGKDITFTGRTNIWEVCWQQFHEAPLCGHGLLNPLLRADMVDDAVGAINAHNTILELLFDWGVIGLLLWLSVVVFALRRMSAECVWKKLANPIFLALLCYAPVTLAEDRSFSVNIYMILSLASQLPSACKKEVSCGSNS